MAEWLFIEMLPVFVAIEGGTKYCSKATISPCPVVE